MCTQRLVMFEWAVPNQPCHVCNLLSQTCGFRVESGQIGAFYEEKQAVESLELT